MAVSMWKIIELQIEYTDDAYTQAHGLHKGSYVRAHLTIMTSCQHWSKKYSLMLMSSILDWFWVWWARLMRS